LYTDTEELSAQYHEAAGLSFGVLPIPFRSQLIQAMPRNEGPLRIAFIGDARDEKGFHWLPELVEQLMDQYVRTGRVRFLFQASPVDAPWNEGSCRALRRLREYDRSQVELVGTGGPLGAEEYFQLVSQVDILLCPFHKTAYQSRSSGTLAEAIAAGVPAIVPEGTWLSRQQAPRARETFEDLPSFITAVRRVIDNYSAYRAAAQASKDHWLSFHTPKNLVKCLLASEGDEYMAWRRTA
jgi:glycosyltransferase involved in cell wall biosynthesis